MRGFKNFYHRWKRHLIDGILLRGRRARFEDQLIIETTNRCSLGCSCCPNGNGVPLRKRGVMSRDTFEKVLANIDMPVKNCFLHLCGEPFLNPDLPYFCQKLIERKIYPIIFSNGYGIDLELLDKVLDVKGVKIGFSMELYSSYVYESIRRPGLHSKALQSIEAISQHFAKAKRKFSLNMILKPGITSEEVAGIARRMFDDFPQLSSITFSGEWPWPGLPETGNIAGHLSRDPHLCHRIKGLPVILWDGRVSFCDLDYDGSAVIGNITEDPLSKIANNPAARAIRRDLLSHNYQKRPLCGRCVLPRYSSFTLTVNPGMLKKMGSEAESGYFKVIDDYFNG